MGKSRYKGIKDCPALGRSISSAECGNDRNSKINCPADCPHNPFSPENYLDHFRQLEEKMIHKTFGLLAKELSPNELREMGEAESQFEVHTIHTNHLVSRSLPERWSENGQLNNWRNDERVLLDCYKTLRIALTEIQRIHDGVSVIARDLLRPELGELRILDTGFVKNVLRFDVHLSWIYKVPAGWRSSGAAVAFPETGNREPEQAFQILLEHLGAPKEDQQPWLMQNMTLLRNALTEIHQARTDASYQASDIREIHRHYRAEPGRLKKLIKTLKNNPLVDQDDESTNDFEATVLEELEPGERMQPVIGHLTFTDGRIEAQAMSMPRANALQQFLIDHEPSLDMENESIINHGERASFRSKRAELVPPALLQGAGPIELTQFRTMVSKDAEQSIQAQFTESIITHRIPALDGLSPLEAAKRPELRQRLVRQMKGHVRNIDKMRRERGIDVDFNDSLAELGLDELIQPPVPLGEATTPNHPISDALHRPPTQDAIDPDEQEKRIMLLLEDPSHFDHVSDRHAELLEAVEVLPAGQFLDTELGHLRIAALLALLTLHPEPPPGFKPDLARMTEWYDQMLEIEVANESVEGELERITKATGHPALVKQVTSMVATAAESSDTPLRDESSYELILAIAALVRELAHWPWRR